MLGRIAGSGLRGGERGRRGSATPARASTSTLELADPAGTAEGRADGPVDLTPLHIMEALRRAVLAAGVSTFPGALLEAARPAHEA